LQNALELALASVGKLTAFTLAAKRTKRMKKDNLYSFFIG
jgi:hypothetical protein